MIGTFASPHDRGTASIHFHHQSGRQGGTPGMWGYVEGGMGMVSFILCDIARDAGAVVLTGAPVARIIPGDGVELEGGERVRASCVVSNADPRDNARSAGRCRRPRLACAGARGAADRLHRQVNFALKELPSFKARPGTRMPHHLGQINIPLSKNQWQSGYDAARAGRLPERLWCELYFQTAHDSSVAPAGRAHDERLRPVRPAHIRERRLGYPPRRSARPGDPLDRPFLRQHPRSDHRRRKCSGPPDIEREVGLSGGHIFQGECLPENMWDRRFSPRTPMPGVFLCGACTYPGGSVIAINGRNAAMEILNGR